MNLIACVQRQEDKWAIGNKNALLFRYSDDLRFFKQHTQYKIIVMGRKTFESLPNLLKNRIHVIITSDTSYDPYSVYQKDDNSPCFVANSLDELFNMINIIVSSKDNSFTIDDIWVIGGEQIYKSLLPYCEEAYISVVEKQDLKEADAFFPNLDKDEDWKCVRIQVADNDPLSLYLYVNTNKKSF